MFNFSALVLTFLFPFNLWMGFFQPNHRTVNYVPPAKPVLAAVVPLPAAAPQPSPISTPIPTPAPSSGGSGSMEDYFIQKINDFRHSKGLPSVQKDSNTCNFAKVRAREITGGFSHDGFTSRVNSRTLPYPSYSLVAENIAMNSNYQAVVDAWANSPGHAANMSADTPYVCVESNGNYYAYEGWKP